MALTVRKPRILELLGPSSFAIVKFFGQVRVHVAEIAQLIDVVFTLQLLGANLVTLELRQNQLLSCHLNVAGLVSSVTRLHYFIYRIGFK